MIDTNEIRSQVPYPMGCDAQTIHNLCDELNAARAEIDRLRAGKPKPQGKTVKVKVAVAVDKNGKWSASGWSNAEGDEAMDIAIEGVDPNEHRYWLTADLPIPEETTVEGEVEKNG